MPRDSKIKRVLVTGASGQLGAQLTRQLLAAGYHVRALVHRTPVPGVESIRGSISDLAVVRRALKGVDAVCQLATTKEDPESFIDVSVRGTFNLLEAARELGTIRRWILAGGDAAMGIYYYPQPGPITESMPHRAYPGCYALSKVLEEVLGQQYRIQYGLPYTCLRCSWILHGEMILEHFSARRLMQRLTPRQRRHLRGGKDAVAILMHPNGKPLVRHVVALPDAAAAFLLALREPAAVGETFNIAAPAPFNYAQAGEYLAAKTGLPTLGIKVPEAYDFEIDIAKARRVLSYRPQFDIYRMIDAALEIRARRRAAK